MLCLKLFKERCSDIFQYNLKNELNILLSCNNKNIIKVVYYNFNATKFTYSMKDEAITIFDYIFQVKSIFYLKPYLTIINKQETLNNNVYNNMYKDINYDKSSNIINIINNYYKNKNIKCSLKYFTFKLYNRLNLYDYIAFTKNINNYICKSSDFDVVSTYINYFNNVKLEDLGFGENLSKQIFIKLLIV